MIAPARTAAFHALRAIDTGRLDLPSALARGREQLRDERDRALALEIVTGTVRWQRSLDHLIRHYSRRGLEQSRRGGRHHSAHEPLSAPASRSSAGRGDRGRCRRSWRERRESRALRDS